ncbi:MAG: glycine zipper 2TM domain-containing protein [Alphaproteobacteria bacterium]|nr:glycine zipper 2TM domain-containing protein [Alphaproteobacteria bacterium]
MKTKILAMLAISTMALTACQQGVGVGQGSTTGMGNKQMIGGATGAILGGVLGSKVGKGSGQLVGVGVGALLGTLLGSELGASLDKADLAYAQQATDRAYSAPVGQSISWNNPESGNSGTITPTREGVSNTTGRVCREYTQTIYVGGKKETAVGQACKAADGTWSVVN